MKAFAALCAALDAATATQAKLAALQAYFAQAAPADAAWAAYFLAGGKPRQTVPSAALRTVAGSCAGVPAWLFDECYQAVGDLAETIAHLLPPPTHGHDEGLAQWVTQRVLPLRGMDDAARAAALRSCWAMLDAQQRFVFNKLITGGFRVGVSRLLVTRALAAVAGLDAQRVAQRFMGYTDARAVPSA